MPVQLILNYLGLINSRFEAVHGGDINECWRIESKGAIYFLKINEAKLYPDMFKKEAKGLDALKENSSLNIPSIIKNGSLDNKQFLLLEWLQNNGKSTNWKTFGVQLALLHRKKQNYFGWEEDNYIGTLIQKNTEKKFMGGVLCRVQDYSTNYQTL